MVAGSYLTPSFEHACVSDAMRPRVLACRPTDPLREVARLMATEHVHAVVVVREDQAWAVISDLDLLRCADRIDELTADDVRGPRPLTVGPGDRLDGAAREMSHHGVSHAVVVGRHDRPIGVLSTLDVAGVLAWGLA